jgi:hypothetical protein
LISPTTSAVLYFSPRPEGEGLGVRVLNGTLSRNPLRAKGRNRFTTAL